MDISPVDITANKSELYLTIKWNDGLESKYPFKLLRNACPCAQCRGGHENMSAEPDEDVFVIPLLNIDTFKLLNLEIVGSYALRIEWADTHQAGIYNWSYLRILWDRILENEN